MRRGGSGRVVIPGRESRLLAAIAQIEQVHGVQDQQELAGLAVACSGRSAAIGLESPSWALNAIKLLPVVVDGVLGIVPFLF